MRVLICIGCDEYLYADPLNGAERDAKRMYETLLQPERGDYDQNRSRLVLSPSLDQVREAIREALFVTDDAIDTFTFFFAGHGTVHASSFYMWLRESKPHAQSVTAFSLAELLRILNDAAPAQTNIIIDACESGGVIKDLGTLLNADGMGASGSPGVSIVATSAMNQGSGESGAGGFGTNAILDCIEGRRFVSDRGPFLDLVEIGRRVSESYEWPDQDPVVWGINLIDAPRFCRNPKFEVDPSAPFRNALREWPAPPEGIDGELHETLWRSYSSLNRSFEPISFVKEMARSFAKLADDPANLARVAARLVDPMRTRARESGDEFQAARTCAGLAVALLPFTREQIILETVSVLSDLVVEELLEAGGQLVDDLEQEKYSLLGSGGGSSELFFLPMRISSVLGWMGAARLIVPPEDEKCAEIELVIDRLIAIISDTYANSIHAISDAQASSWCVAFAALLEMGRLDAAEELVGRIFNSIVVYRGKLARSDIPNDKVLGFLLARHQGSYETAQDLLEQPIETLTVLMHVANHLGLQEVWDPSLWKLDGLAFHAFVPTSYDEYSQERIENGRNLLWTIGFDVFKVQEFLDTWPEDSPVPFGEAERSLSILSSVLFSDRVPWFAILKRSSR